MTNALFLALRFLTLDLSGDDGGIDDAACGEVDPVCEVSTTLGGITVTTCDGQVAQKCDSVGNCRIYLGDGTIMVRTEGQAPLILESR